VFATEADCNANTGAGLYETYTTKTGCFSSGSTSDKYTVSGGAVTRTTYQTADCSGSGTDSGPYTPAQTCAEIHDLDQAKGYIRFDGPPDGGSSSSSVCFSASETVELQDGSTKQMKDVAIGDVVLTASTKGELLYAPVIALPHGKNEIVADFVSIVAGPEYEIKLTPDHLILAGECDSDVAASLMKASDVTVVLCLSTKSGPVPVKSTELIRSAGLYTAVTTSDYLVVNGIVASPFAVSHTVGNAFYGIYRAMYSVAPLMTMSKAFVAAHQSFSTLVMSL